MYVLCVNPYSDNAGRLEKVFQNQERFSTTNPEDSWVKLTDKQVKLAKQILSNEEKLVWWWLGAAFSMGDEGGTHPSFCASVEVTAKPKTASYLMKDFLLGNAFLFIELPAIQQAQPQTIKIPVEYLKSLANILANAHRSRQQQTTIQNKFWSCCWNDAWGCDTPWEFECPAADIFFKVSYSEWVLLKKMLYAGSETISIDEISVEIEKDVEFVEMLVNTGQLFAYYEFHGIIDSIPIVAVNNMLQSDLNYENIQLALGLRKDTK